VAASPWAAAGISVLFVGNSYTFGRTDPALAFVSGAVFSNLTGTNSYQVGIINPASTTIPKAEFNSFTPHTRTATWGGVPGIFKQLTVQANLDYDVSLPTRNAASLRGHFLNTANSSWDMRSNISSGKWDKVVLQEQSDEALGPKTVGTSVLGSNYPPVQAYVNLMENWIHKGTALSYTEQAMFNAVYNNTAACVAAGGTTAICNSTTSRIIPAITNASAATQSYLPQTWARPNLINAPGASAVDPKTGNVTYSGAPAASFFSDLESIAAEMSTGMSNVAAFAALDNGGATAITAVTAITGIVPVGQAYLTAVQAGFATRNMYAPGAGTDGLIDLWFNDGTHASKWGSYLSALTLFGSLTGQDPAQFGPGEIAAFDLGVSPADALALQRVASYELGFTTVVPEPSTVAMWALALLALAWCVRGRASR